MERVLRFWSCDLTGEECCTILRNGEEITVSADEGYDIWSKEDSYSLILQ
tara:strand:+ start:360 stop:509 length:150 start_codon:yes stop_codon:yes gene_type:complete